MLPVFCLIFKLFNISSITFLAAKTNQNEKKIALPSVVCHGLPEIAFQANQLYNVTWSSNYIHILQYFLNLSSTVMIKNITEIEVLNLPRLPVWPKL